MQPVLDVHDTNASILDDFSNFKINSFQKDEEWYSCLKAFFMEKKL